MAGSTLENLINATDHFAGDRAEVFESEIGKITEKFAEVRNGFLKQKGFWVDFLVSQMGMSLVTRSPHILWESLCCTRVFLASGIITEEEMKPLGARALKAEETASEKVIPLEEIKPGGAFKHGKYRIPTAAHVIEAQMAAIAAGDIPLTMGIESNKRLQTYAGKTEERLWLIDEMRLLAYACIQGVKYVSLIEGEGWDNQFYLNLLRRFLPAIYFSSCGYNKDIRRERIYRAKSIGAKLITLVNLPMANSTSTFELFDPSWLKSRR